MINAPPALIGFAQAIEMAAYKIAETNGLDPNKVPLCCGMAFVNQWTSMLVPVTEKPTDADLDAHYNMMLASRLVLFTMVRTTLIEFERLIYEGRQPDEKFFGGLDTDPNVREGFKEAMKLLTKFGEEMRLMGMEASGSA